MSVFIKYTGNLNNISKVEAHVKYVGFRSREKEGEQKGFFSDKYDSADFKDFLKSIHTDKALRHQKSIKVHKIVFSLKEHDYENFKESGKDYKELIRKTMKDYEEKHGVKLEWIASVHETDGHPHVHVIIKGTAKDRASDKNKRVFFKKEDFKNFKESFNKEFEKEATYEKNYKLDDRTKEAFKEMNRDGGVSDFSKALGAAFDSIKRDIDEKHREAERSKMRQIKKHVRQQEKGERGR